MTNWTLVVERAKLAFDVSLFLLSFGLFVYATLVLFDVVPPPSVKVVAFWALIAASHAVLPGRRTP